MTKSKDIEMKSPAAKDTKRDDKGESTSASKSDADSTVSEQPQKDPDLLTLEDIKEQVKCIERAVTTKEPRFMSRVVMTLAHTRKKLNAVVLTKLLHGYSTAPANQGQLAELLRFIPQTMETDAANIVFRPRTPKTSNQPLLPEIDIYLHILVQVYLLDQKMYKQAVECGESLMTKVTNQNRRTLDVLGARAYFYYSRAYELNGQLEKIRPFLFASLRTCTLRCNHEGQSMLLNLLLRNFLHYNLHEQADKLVSKSTFPEHSNNAQTARFLYYLGCIKAAQLEYSAAHKHLIQALRKAPQHSAVGFRQTVQKLAVTVELLLGDIPDRATFYQPAYKKTLTAYLQLTQAVRAGNLTKFNEVLQTFGAKFQAEGTYSLIIRLRHNVIKTAVRMVNLSYSRISLTDVAQKLSLDSPKEAEYIVSKAIRDGVIEATIDHEPGCVQSNEMGDVYRTKEPMNAFHQRINFCLDIHNHLVKAMRFPPKSYNTDRESAEERREREQQELETAKEIADEDFDGFP